MMKNQYPFSQFVGVDVSKATLDFALADDEPTRSISNTSEQIVSELIGRIKDRPSTIVVMEATGGYEDLLVSRLHQHQIALAVVNPRRVRECRTKQNERLRNTPDAPENVIDAPSTRLSLEKLRPRRASLRFTKRPETYSHKTALATPLNT